MIWNEPYTNEKLIDSFATLYMARLFIKQGKLSTQDGGIINERE